MLSHSVFVVATIAFGLICLFSSCSHIWNYRAFKDALYSHRVIPTSVAGVAVVCVIIVELSLSIVAIVSLTFTFIPDYGLWLTGALAGMVFAGYAAYLNYIRISHNDEPTICGCGIGEIEVGGETVFRAVASGTLGLIGFWGITSMKTLLTMWSGDLFLLILTGLSLTMLVIWLPVTLWSRRTLLEMVYP